MSRASRRPIPAPPSPPHGTRAEAPDATMLDGDAHRDVHVLVASHSHPAISKGGAEVAAFEMFRALNDAARHSASFLGCSRVPTYRRLGQGITQPFGDDEYVYSAAGFDWFKFANTDPKFPREFKSLLRHLQPDIVHFHHYINFGLEAFGYVKQVLPNARVVLTLHEYLLICHHQGQMIKTGKGLLCSRSGLVDCAACFPALAPADFLLRNLYARRFLDAVDQFVAPSRFLADRYVAWGIPAARISVIENITRPPTLPPAVPRERTDGRRTFRVGFFGQISNLKGLGVLFEAARIFERERMDDIVFEIHGDYHGQTPEFQAEFLARLEQAGHNVHYHGPYGNDLVDALMQSVEAVVVPSVWWENSPVVIQEALRNRRPIVCSDIGGMAEKVRDGLDGVHFPVGSARGLVAAIAELARNDELWRTIAAGQRPPALAETTLADHLVLYDSLVGATAHDA